MRQDRHVALLRGINVGGRNVIRMADLRARFEGMGLTGVATYIQSGNVVFSAAQDGDRLAERIEAELSTAFGTDARIVLLAADDLERVVTQAPHGFGTEPDHYRYDVLFVRPPRRADEAVGQIATRPGVDTVAAGDHALYFRRLTSRAAQSLLPRLVGTPLYRDLTIRNWNTTMRLLEMTR